MKWNGVFAGLTVVLGFIAMNKFPIKEYQSFIGCTLFSIISLLYLCARTIRYGEHG